MTDWLGKPYYSLDAWFKHIYGQKCYKIAVDAGLTCPNRDGTLDTRGCIFCIGGSGNFAVSADIGNVRRQIRAGLSRFHKKETIHEKTAVYIRRGYELPIYEEAVRNLVFLRIPCITHVILGLPGENTEDMLETVEYLNGTERCPKPFGVKLQLLHVLKGTDLERDYLDGKFQVFTEDEYVDVVIQCIRHLDPDIVLHRVTGDGPKALLTAPLWSGNKKQVLNHLNWEMKAIGARQGDFVNMEAVCAAGII